MYTARYDVKHSMIKKTLPKGYKLELNVIPFTVLHFLATISQVIYSLQYYSSQYYSLQRDNHASKRIHFFLSNRNTIFIVRSSNFIFTLKLTIRLKILNHPNDSHENFLCDVGEEQSHQRSRGEEGKQR